MFSQYCKGFTLYSLLYQSIKNVVTLGSKTSVQYPLRYLRYSTEPNQLLVLEWLRVGGVRLPTNKQHHLYGLATTVLLPDRWTQK